MEDHIEELCKAFDSTGSADNDLRREAENFIISSMDKPEFVKYMLEIASNPKYNEERCIDVTQAAAIQLK